MATWYFMLILVLLMPLFMIGFGWMFMTNAPKDINTSFGYRTKRFMKMFLVMGREADVIRTTGFIILGLQLFDEREVRDSSVWSTTQIKSA